MQSIERDNHIVAIQILNTLLHSKTLNSVWIITSRFLNYCALEASKILHYHLNIFNASRNSRKNANRSIWKFDVHRDDKRAAIKVILTIRADTFLVCWALCLIFCTMQTRIPVCSARCLANWPSSFCTVDRLLFFCIAHSSPLCLYDYTTCIVQYLHLWNCRDDMCNIKETPSRQRCNKTIYAYNM